MQYPPIARAFVVFYILRDVYPPPEHAFPPFFGNIGAIVSSGSVTASWLLYLILMIVGMLQTSKSVTGAWLLYQKGVR